MLSQLIGKRLKSGSDAKCLLVRLGIFPGRGKSLVVGKPRPRPLERGKGLLGARRGQLLGGGGLRS